MQEVEGSTPTGGTCLNDFSNPVDQDIHTQWALSWKIAVGDCSVTECRGLSNRQNCACARKTLQTQRGRTHGAQCVRQWFRTAEPLGEHRYENWNTHTRSGVPIRKHILVFSFIKSWQGENSSFLESTPVVKGDKNKNCGVVYSEFSNNNTGWKVS